MKPNRQATVTGQLEEDHMHPMFVALFIETDADDLLTEERDKQRRAREARRGRSARVIRAVATYPNRPRRP